MATSTQKYVRATSAWWNDSGRKFAAAQWRRLVTGLALGSLIAIAAHLFWRDSIFIPMLRRKWEALPAQGMFDGVPEYKLELQVLCATAVAAVGIPLLGAARRYLRAWWAGIVSLTTLLVASVTATLLWHAFRPIESTAELMSLLAAAIILELWRSENTTRIRRSRPRMPPLNIPAQHRDPSVEARWQLSSSDDPIAEWRQDIIGRTSVVELLAEHIFVQQTPIVALHGGLGDGKSSVLRLLRLSLGGHAITVSFSTWLPGSDETLAIDLFGDIATECRRMFHIPQLKKRATAYARTISGSVSFLAGLKEILPAQSQQQEIEELRDTLARVPAPIVVLLDEVDRMQRDEILVLLKILRGASSMPNVTFICAFSDEEIKKQLSQGAALSFDYLEKFFPVSVNLAPPDPIMIGRLTQTRIKTVANNGHWFLGTDEKTFGELLERMWQDSLSRVCTNLRKTSLLLNDLNASARIIGREVNALDLIGIETIRRFAPTIYQLIRKNPVFLTYGGDSWTKRRYVSERTKGKEASEFFETLEGQLAQSAEPEAFRNILSLLFPRFVEGTKQGSSIHSIARPTDEQIAEQQKRICDSDHFTIYFRAAVPEDMFSEAELSTTITRLNEAKTEKDCERIFREVLDGMPPGYAKRTDFLWKISLAAKSRLKDDIAEWLAYAAASRATDYTYDLVNIGEAAKALNIVFESAERSSQSPKAQEVLEGAMNRSTDDTFALRLLEYTENRGRNKILTNFKYIDLSGLKTAFMERMRRRYGNGVDPGQVDISTGDWYAFQKWAGNSNEDRETERNFWRGYIGLSRKHLAKAVNFLYPQGYSWSEDPRNLIEKFIPVGELKTVLETARDEGEPLDDTESNAIARFRELLNGKWFDIARPGALADVTD